MAPCLLANNHWSYSLKKTCNTLNCMEISILGVEATRHGYELLKNICKTEIYCFTKLIIIIVSVT